MNKNQLSLIALLLIPLLILLLDYGMYSRSKTTATNEIAALHAFLPSKPPLVAEQDSGCVATKYMFEVSYKCTTVRSYTFSADSDFRTEIRALIEKLRLSGWKLRGDYTTSIPEGERKSGCASFYNEELNKTDKVKIKLCRFDEGQDGVSNQPVITMSSSSLYRPSWLMMAYMGSRE